MKRLLLAAAIVTTTVGMAPELHARRMSLEQMEARRIRICAQGQHTRWVNGRCRMEAPRVRTVIRRVEVEVVREVEVHADLTPSEIDVQRKELLNKLLAGAAYSEAGWNGFNLEFSPSEFEEIFTEENLIESGRGFATHYLKLPTQLKIAKGNSIIDELVIHFKIDNGLKFIKDIAFRASALRWLGFHNNPYRGLFSNKVIASSHETLKGLQALITLSPEVASVADSGAPADHSSTLGISRTSIGHLLRKIVNTMNNGGTYTLNAEAVALLNSKIYGEKKQVEPVTGIRMFTNPGKGTVKAFPWHENASEMWTKKFRIELPQELKFHAPGVDQTTKYIVIEIAEPSVNGLGASSGDNFTQGQVTNIYLTKHGTSGLVSQYSPVGELDDAGTWTHEDRFPIIKELIIFGEIPEGTEHISEEV